MNTSRLLSLFFLVSFFLNTSAQNSTNTPASMFGIGDISMGVAGKYVGMGGVGIALRSDNFLNSLNPSALTAMDSAKFVYEAGANLSFEKYTSRERSTSAVTGNVRNLGMGCRILPSWYAAVGITPLSSMGYAVTIDQPVEGTDGNTISSLFEGSGGLSKIYLSNAFKLSKRFSLGANLSYILGNTTQSEVQGNTTIKEISYKKAFYADFGLQYVTALNKKWNMTLGGIYGYKQQLNLNNAKTIINSSNSETITEYLNPKSQFLPQFFGGGIALNNKRLTLTADYKYSQWSKMKSSNSSVSFNDQQQLNFGADLLSKNVYSNTWHFMVGTGLSSSYVVIKDQKPLNYYISTGLGIPVMTGNLLSVGFKYNSQCGANTNIEKNQSFSLFLNITFSERTPRSKIY
ncbi:hypothetical protein [uncultured Bacteroides sp.]|uniref:hypothetical protein n=1 Tax=uncultured Bacteroides sp. TaxID=162156 RepID=UPI002AAAC6B7|nr:hypothetical protein [uncultured Bacteroides sp.]